jgi:hypothetical protein
MEGDLPLSSPFLEHLISGSIYNMQATLSFPIAIKPQDIIIRYLSGSNPAMLRSEK